MMSQIPGSLIDTKPDTDKWGKTKYNEELTPTSQSAKGTSLYSICFFVEYDNVIYSLKMRNTERTQL